MSKRFAEEKLFLLTTLIVFVLFGITPSGDYWFDHWAGKWAVLLALLCIIISVNLWKAFHPTAGLFFAVLSLGAIKSFGWNFIDRDAAFTGFALITFVAFFQQMHPRHSETLKQFFTVVCLLSSLMTIAQFNFHPYYRAAFSGNASMNGCLIAVTLPIAMQWLKDHYGYIFFETLFVVSGGLACSAILMTNTSIPIGVITVVTTAYILAETKDKWNALLAFTISSGLMLWMAFLTDHKSFYSMSGRKYFWMKVLEWWWGSEKYFLGVGTGSGKQVFTWSFVMDNVHAGRELSQSASWAHNDFIQTLFENGLVGLASALLMFGYALKASFNRPWLFASVTGYGAMAFFNYPAHLPIHAFLGVSLLWLTHKGFYEPKDPIS